jgi:hypothetical protein
LHESEDDSFPASANLFAIANRTGYFACGCPKGTRQTLHGLQTGLIFGKTEILRTAFEEAEPKSTASLKGAYKVDFAQTPTHIRFTGDEQLIIATLPKEGTLVLECEKLREEVEIPSNKLTLEICRRLYKVHISNTAWRPRRPHLKPIS